MASNALCRIIQDLTDEVVVSIGALYKASEAVALLDLLRSFAHASICELSSFTIPAVVLFVYIVRNYGEFHALT